MALMRGTEHRDEVDVGQIIRDARPTSVRVLEALGQPYPFAATMAGVGCLAFAAPFLTPALTLVSGILWWHFRSRRPGLPLRVPKHFKTADPTEKGKPGEGILFLGNDRTASGNGQECWISNDDARTHMLLMGTTGSGKSQYLMSLASNALAWGSGFIYVDGKADNSLPHSIYAMCKRLGREDDFLVVNFLTGDVEAFARGRDDHRLSNTINVFADGSSETWTQIVSGLMAEAGGDNAMWKGLAVGMINAVLKGLAYKKFKYGMPVDSGVIRDHIGIGKLMDLAREFANDPEVNKDLVLKPLEAYLLNLPGFSWEKNLLQGEELSEDTKKQHDFRSMQFLRQLTMLADTYGSIFRHRLPEVDMLDVVLNRRVLVVMIPSLEKSEEESEGLGKLLVSALKLMMSLTLGSEIEGLYKDVVESKVTKAPAPYICILDELGYYFTKGLAVMFAQARSLGFMMVAAGQDLPAMMKGKNKEEAESVIANTKFKISLPMEDPQQTADLFIRTAGDALVAESSGYSGQTNFVTAYRDMMNVSMQKRQRVTLQELRDLDSGQGVLLWRDRVVRFATFYLFGSAEISRNALRVNRMVKLYAPSVGMLEAFSAPIASAAMERQVNMLALLCGDKIPSYKSTRSSFVKALAMATSTCPRDHSTSDIQGAMFTRTMQLWEMFAKESDNETDQATEEDQAAPEATEREEEHSEGESGGGTTGGVALTPRVEEPAVEAAEELDISGYLGDLSAFVVEKKSEILDATPILMDATETVGEPSVASADVPEAGERQEAKKPSLDWVDTALAEERQQGGTTDTSGGGFVMEKTSAEMLAMMDSALLGGAEVAPVEAASRAATKLLDALAYEAPAGTDKDKPRDVEAQVNEVMQMFNGL